MAVTMMTTAIVAGVATGAVVGGIKGGVKGALTGGLLGGLGGGFGGVAAGWAGGAIGGSVGAAIGSTTGGAIAGTLGGALGGMYAGNMIATAKQNQALILQQQQAAFENAENVRRLMEEEQARATMEAADEEQRMRFLQDKSFRRLIAQRFTKARKAIDENFDVTSNITKTLFSYA